FFFFFQAEDGIRDLIVTGVQTCALPIYLALDLVDLLRQRVDLDPQPARRFVHQVDRLVGEKAVADVAMRQGRRSHQRVVRDAYEIGRASCRERVEIWVVAGAL